MIDFAKKNKTLLLHIGVRLLALLVVWLILFFAFRNVVFYHDDFANASLSYGYVVPGVVGTSFTWDQVMEWQSHIYMEWGGRIFYSTLLVYLFKDGPFLFFFLQAFVLTIVFYLVALLFKGNIFQEIATLFAGLFFFFCINRVYQCGGSFWASASICYIWPLLPLLLSVNIALRFDAIQRKTLKVLSVIGMVVFSCLGALGHEMFGALMVLFFVLLWLVKFKKWKKSELVSLAIAAAMTLVCALVLLLAPGNRERADIYPEYYSLNFFQRIYVSLPVIFKDVNHGDQEVFGIAIAAMSICCFFGFAHRATKAFVKYIFVGAGIVYFVLFLMEPGLSGGFNFLASILLLGLQLFSLCGYFWIIGKREYAAWTFVVFASAYCFMLSPVYGGRTVLPFLIFIPSIVLEGSFQGISFFKTVNIKKPLAISTHVVHAGSYLTLAILSAIGFKGYVVGFAENKIVWDHNDMVLRKAAENEEKTIYLYRYESSYHEMVPYYSGYSYINGYMKSYYAINDEVELYWLPSSCGYFNLNKYQAASNYLDAEKIEGAYEPNENSVWTSDRLAFCVTAEADFELIFYNVFGVDNTVTVMKNGEFVESFTVPSGGGYVGFDVKGDADLVKTHYAFYYSYYLKGSENPSGDQRDLGLLTWQNN